MNKDDCNHKNTKQAHAMDPGWLVCDDCGKGWFSDEERLKIIKENNKKASPQWIQDRDSRT